MKQIYKYLVLTIGTAILPLSTTCQAAQPASAQIAPSSAEDLDKAIKAILDIIPEDNPKRRNAFLAAVWKAKKSVMESDDRLKTFQDWNKIPSDLEDAKYAVQTCIQQQEYKFFSTSDDPNKLRSEERAYMIGIENEVRLFKTKIQSIKFHEQSRLKHLESLFILLPRLGIGCPGCALTWDIIMDIIRFVCIWLMENADDPQAKAALQALCETIQDREDPWPLAHTIPGLPQIVTETVRSMRTQLRSEFTSKDISSLLSILETSNDFSPFEKPRLRQALNAALVNNPKGISIDALRESLWAATKNKEKVDFLLQSLDREVSDISTTIETPKAFGGRLAVYSGGNGTEAQLPSASKDRATLNEEERTNTRSAMQFFQQRETQ